MSDDQVIILNRLLDKLSAVRATLKNDERVLLDSMVLQARILVAADEVEQHGLEARAVPAAEAKIEDSAVDSADEVAQHAMQTRTVPAAEAKVEAGAVADAVASQYYKITLDEELESYMIFH
jgi:hypothetical protein